MAEKLQICQTCLSSDRNLIPLKKLQNLLRETNIREIKHGGLCWECKSAILKFSEFKTQVRKAQESLCNGEINNLNSLTKLSIKTIFNINIQGCGDPLTGHNEAEVDPDTIKQEITDDESKHDIESDLDEKPLSTATDVNIYVDTIDIYLGDSKRNVRRESKRRGCVKKTKAELDYDSDTSENEEVSEKFLKVVFTEEEMLRNREDKRNRPNFKKIPYKCDTCVLGFTRKETYDVHMEKKHDETIGTVVCDVCRIRFSSETSAERHRRRHYVCYRCRLCRYECAQLWSAVNHCRDKHGADTAERIHCQQCPEVVKTPEDLAEHTRSEHTLYCNECGEKFKGKNTLRAHIRRIHAVKREFRCDLCNKQFKTKTRLESHMVGHNSTLAMKLAYCGQCDVQYKNIYVYRNHLKNSANHSGDAYPCTACNKKFASKVYLKKHYNFYHLHKSQFKCEECDKLFISEWRLKNHRQLHHGLSRTRNYPCDECGKKFFTLSTLKGHQLTHSERRTYMCEDCGDTFKQRPSLYTHCRLVHRGGKRRA